MSWEISVGVSIFEVPPRLNRLGRKFEFLAVQDLHFDPSANMDVGEAVADMARRCLAEAQKQSLRRLRVETQYDAR